MAKAIATFTVRDPSGQLVTFHAEDDVPDEIAVLVGAHVLDSQPDAVDLDVDTEGADEVVVAALEQAKEYIKELEDEVESLEEKVKELTELKEKVLSGDLTDLDLDSLNSDDGTGDDASVAAGDADEEKVELYDPSQHDWREVLKYLEGADEDEDARVRAAEKAGKNRPSIVGDDD